MTDFAQQENPVRSLGEIEGEFRTFSPKQIKTHQCVVSAVSSLNDPAHDEMSSRSESDDDGPLTKAFTAASDALRGLPTSRVYMELLTMSRKRMSDRDIQKLQRMYEILAPKAVSFGIQSE